MSPVRDYRVTGRVQGVGFRAFAVRRARALGLGGGVRNEADGSVVIRAEGAADAIERLRRALEQGPPAARVAAVEELEPGAGRDPERFDARF